MICPSCGKKTLFDVVTCGRCGYDFAARAAEQHAVESASPAAPPVTAPGTITSDAAPEAGVNGGKIIGGIAIVIFGIGITAMMYSDVQATGGGRVYAPVGLIAWGVLLVIRGLAGR